MFCLPLYVFPPLNDANPHNETAESPIFLWRFRTFPMAVSVFTATFAISLNHQPTGIKHERKEYEKDELYQPTLQRYLIIRCLYTNIERTTKATK
jgi:hypothetical protein